MKTKIAEARIERKPRINVVTLGCSKNIHDSEVLMGQLKGNKMNVIHEANDVREDDMIVINTRGLIDNAKQESIDTILEYIALKEEGKLGKVIVTGCLSERYNPHMMDHLRNVDVLCATTYLQKSHSSV